VFRSWGPGGVYAVALNAFEALISIQPDALKRLREHEPHIDWIKPEFICDRIPGVTPSHRGRQRIWTMRFSNQHRVPLDLIPE